MMFSKLLHPWFLIGLVIAFALLTPFARQYLTFWGHMAAIVTYWLAWTGVGLKFNILGYAENS